MTIKSKDYISLYEQIDILGMNREELISNLEKRSFDELAEIIMELYLSVPQKEHEQSFFNFSACDSIAGAPFPCEAIDCRLRRVEELSNFAVLYADIVTVAFPLNHYVSSLVDEGTAEIDVEQLADDIQVILAYRPLALANLLEFRPEFVVTCHNCHEVLIKTQNEFLKMFEQKVRPYLRRELSDIQANIHFTEDGDPYIAILPFSDFGLDEELDIDFRKYVPSSVKKRMRSGDLEGRLTVKELEEIGVAPMLGREIEKDIWDYESRDMYRSGSLLTDRSLDLKIVQKLNSENSDSVLQRDQYANFMHSLPYVQGVSLNKLLRLREDEGEAFVNFRSSISSGIENGQLIRGRDCRAFIRDEIEPQIASINQMLERSRRHLIGDAAFLAGTVAISAFANMQGVDSLFLDSIAAVCGGESVHDLWKNRRTQVDSAKSSSWYFLWKARRMEGRGHN
jgi:hypothetical protein